MKLLEKIVAATRFAVVLADFGFRSERPKQPVADSNSILLAFLIHLKQLTSMSMVLTKKNAER